jgi:hypothetical protein
VAVVLEMELHLLVQEYFLEHQEDQVVVAQENQQPLVAVVVEHQGKVMPVVMEPIPHLLIVKHLEEVVEQVQLEVMHHLEQEELVV